MLNSRTKFNRILVVGLLVGFIAVLYLWHHIYVLNVGFEIRRLEHGLALVQRDNERLQIELARESSLENIDKIAVERLGMVRPKDVRFVELTGLR